MEDEVIRSRRGFGVPLIGYAPGMAERWVGFGL
jgi:hypothetical protein